MNDDNETDIFLEYLENEYEEEQQREDDRRQEEEAYEAYIQSHLKITDIPISVDHQNRIAQATRIVR